MKSKYKIKMTTIGIVMAVIGTLSTSCASLNRPSRMATELNIQRMELLSEAVVIYWEQRMGGYVRLLRTLADFMGDYEFLPANIRRDVYDQLLFSALESNAGFWGIETVWLPNSIDGMDAQMIGRPGSSATGQHSVIFLRDLPGRGIHQRYTSVVAAELVYYINNPNARYGLAGNPESQTVFGEEVSFFRISYPIISRGSNTVVGTVSALVDISKVQPHLMELMLDNPEIAFMSVYANNGHIIASFNPADINSNISGLTMVYGEDLSTVVQAVKYGENLFMRLRSPVLNDNLKMILRSFEIVSGIDMTWSVAIAVWR